MNSISSSFSNRSHTISAQHSFARCHCITREGENKRNWSDVCACVCVCVWLSWFSITLQTEELNNSTTGSILGTNTHTHTHFQWCSRTTLPISPTHTPIARTIPTVLHYWSSLYQTNETAWPYTQTLTVSHLAFRGDHLLNHFIKTSMSPTPKLYIVHKKRSAEWSASVPAFQLSAQGFGKESCKANNETKQELQRPTACCRSGTIWFRLLDLT